jgi:hypothetical protein
MNSCSGHGVKGWYGLLLNSVMVENRQFNFEITTLSDLENTSYSFIGCFIEFIQSIFREISNKLGEKL